MPVSPGLHHRGLEERLALFHPGSVRIKSASDPLALAAAVRHAQPATRVDQTTVRTLQRRLETKGYLRHTTDGRAYVYEATEPSRSLAYAGP
jgi:predicted transcriptional regulator of viral defense system